jgi:chromosome partitioning protein
LIVTSFVNMKGGVGKTTLALNVAHCLMRHHGKKVAVIDVDPQFNATQCLLTPEEYFDHVRAGKDTTKELFDRSNSLEVSTISGSTTKEPRDITDISTIEKHGLIILPGSIELYRLELRPGEGIEFCLKRFIDEKLSTLGIDHVIIDTPPTPSVWMTSALIASDQYVIPVKPDPLSLIGIDLLRSIIKYKSQNYGLNVKCAGLIFTLVERVDSVVFRQAKRNIKGNEFWSKYLCDSHIPKKTHLAKNQINQPFMLDTDDFDLRTKLLSVVNELFPELSNV